MEAKQQTTTQRDYDKEPIIIIDRMPEISFWGIIIFLFIAIMFIVIFIPTGKNVNEGEIIMYFLIAYIPTFYFIKSRIKEHRSIVFYNDKVVRKWDDEMLEVKFDDIINIKKSFIDFYDTSQRVSQIYRPFVYILLPLSLLFQHPVLIITKYIYKLFGSF